jgi:hypothetical protein
MIAHGAVTFMNVNDAGWGGRHLCAALHFATMTAR